MTTAWSWSLMREPQLRSTTLAATPQVKRQEGASTEWSRAGSCSVSPAEGGCNSQSLYGGSCNQQLLGFNIGMGKVDIRSMSWSREGSPVTCAGIKMGILSQ